MTLARTLQVLLILSFITAVGAAQSSWPPTNTIGPAPGLGTSMDVLDDVDGDGFNDLVVGEPGDSLTSAINGSVTVYSGASASVLFTIAGPPGTRFGSHVASLGDVDGDGVGDFAVGEGKIENDLPPAVGRLIVYSGATAAPLYQFSGADYLVVSIAAVGDVDGDARPDFVMGRPESGLGLGRADLVSGATGAILLSWTGANAGDNLGVAVAGLDDLDGDQLPDIALGKPGANTVPGGQNLLSGEVDFVSSASGALIRTVSDPASSRYGDAIERIGDLDGDNVDDVVIAASGFLSIIPFGAGSVHVVSGATGAPIHRLDPPDASTGMGAALAVGDFDLDGTDDIVFSNPHRTVNTGRVYIYSGATGLQAAVLDGSAIHGYYGYRLTAGDLNGDGMAELCINERYFGGAFATQGGHVSIHGAPAPHIPAGTATVTSNQVGTTSGVSPWGLHGESVASAGDVNGDGVDDIVIGSPGAQYLASALDGRADVISGATGASLYVFNGLAGEDYGKVVAGLGDVDLDGTPDIAVGVQAQIMIGGVSPRIEVRSGATGAALYSVPMSRSPQSIRKAGDLDGDGASDFIVIAADLATSDLEISARAATGAALWTYTPAAGDVIGDGIAVIDDHDGDGVGDIAALGNSGGLGSILILSGATGAVAASIPGPATFSVFHQPIERIEDLDGDGLDDLIVGISAFIFGPSMVEARSSATGAVIYSVLDPLGSAAFGRSIAMMGDIDGDGFSEFAVDSGTAVSVFSGIDGAQAALVALPAGPSVGLSALAAAGDADGDGRLDLVLGASQESPSQSLPIAGSTYRFELAPVVVNPIQGGVPLSGGVLIAEAAGNIGVGAGGPYAVLAVNDSSGGFDRVVEVGVGESITFRMRQAPSRSAPQNFAMFGLIGIPQPSDSILIPTVGTLLFLPAPAMPGAPWLFTLAESYLTPSIGFLPAHAGDWAFQVPNGLPFPTEFTLQAICDNDAPGSTGTTNALVVRVE